MTPEEKQKREDTTRREWLAASSKWRAAWNSTEEKEAYKEMTDAWDAMIDAEEENYDY